jgi:hypothetical protein
MLKGTFTQTRRQIIEERCEQWITARLQERGISVVEETVRFGQDRTLTVCLTVNLKDGFKIRCSVNGGRIHVSVSDDVIQIQKEMFRLSEKMIVFGWIAGYAAGFNQ